MMLILIFLFSFVLTDTIKTSFEKEYVREYIIDSFSKDKVIYYVPNTTELWLLNFTNKKETLISFSEEIRSISIRQNSSIYVLTSDQIIHVYDQHLDLKNRYLLNSELDYSLLYVNDFEQFVLISESEKLSHIYNYRSRQFITKLRFNMSIDESLKIRPHFSNIIVLGGNSDYLFSETGDFKQSLNYESDDLFISKEYSILLKETSITVNNINYTDVVSFSIYQNTLFMFKADGYVTRIRL